MFSLNHIFFQLNFQAGGETKVSQRNANQNNAEARTIIDGIKANTLSIIVRAFAFISKPLYRCGGVGGLDVRGARSTCEALAHAACAQTKRDPE